MKNKNTLNDFNISNSTNISLLNLNNNVKIEELINITEYPFKYKIS